ncbi:MAG: peroxiredoxin [Deltaproteobacteria bacterium]|nr:peroxiredoxin [Deltaproteobacteria bacterium]
MMPKYLISLLLIVCIFIPLPLVAEALSPGDPAPLFKLKNHRGEEFSLESRKGKGWTVLYFYPKAETPGCTKQACAFRDSIEKIRTLNAEVYGVSSDKVDKLSSFHKNHALRFDLLSDPESEVISDYGAKMPVVGIAKRWTFIIDPDLKIRAIERDVDPAADAERVASTLSDLQADSKAVATGSN